MPPGIVAQKTHDKVDAPLSNALLRQCTYCRLTIVAVREDIVGGTSFAGFVKCLPRVALEHDPFARTHAAGVNPVMESIVWRNHELVF